MSINNVMRILGFATRDILVLLCFFGSVDSLVDPRGFVDIQNLSNVPLAINVKQLVKT